MHSLFLKFISVYFITFVNSHVCGGIFSKETYYIRGNTFFVIKSFSKCNVLIHFFFFQFLSFYLVLLFISVNTTQAHILQLHEPKNKQTNKQQEQQKTKRNSGKDAL